ncbi:hypothetical protein VTH82DRAFT_6843 [Thermothelomyces myriococcoides]
MSRPITPTGPAALDDGEPSYIDYEAFLDPSFNPASFANTLVLGTNNPSDTPLDLSTPLSRVLFDIQEIDSHIDSLTTRSALPLLQYTQDNAEASNHILSQLENQITALNDSYAQLDREVTQKHAEADQVRAVASRLWDTLRLARAVSRCLQLGRRLEAQHAELIGTALAASSTTTTSTPTSSLSSTTTTTTTTTTSATSSGPGRSGGGGGGSNREDHRALVRCAHTLLALREVFAGAGTPGAEGYGLDRVGVVRTLREGVVGPIERAVRETAERVVREFSMMGGLSSSTSSSSLSTSTSSSTSTSAATFAQLEETKARTVSALTALWLLTPGPAKSGERWVPSLMLQALEGYLRSALQSSIAGLSRALATLPNLERTLAEVSARGKFFNDEDRNHEIPAKEVDGTIIKSGSTVEIWACGRDSSPSGTEGWFDLYDGDTKVCHIYFNSPWGPGSNEFTVSERAPESEYGIAEFPRVAQGSALGQVGVAIFKTSD